MFPFGFFFILCKIDDKANQKTNTELILNLVTDSCAFCPFSEKVKPL